MAAHRLDSPRGLVYRPGFARRAVARGIGFYLSARLSQDAAGSQRRVEPGSDFRSRQQCRSGAQGPEEEDAARRQLPRDEAPRALREALGKARPPEGRGRPSRSQAGPQARPARRPVAGAEAASAPRLISGSDRTIKGRPSGRPFRCSIAEGWVPSGTCAGLGDPCVRPQPVCPTSPSSPASSSDARRRRPTPVRARHRKPQCRTGRPA